MANDLLGKDEILEIHDGTTYLPIGCLTTHTVSKAREITDGTKTKCNLNPQGVPQAPTYELSFEAVANDDEITKITEDKMDAEMVKDTPTFWRITRGGVGIKFGKAFVTSIEHSAPVEDVVTWSGSLVGVDAISETDLFPTV